MNAKSLFFSFVLISIFINDVQAQDLSIEERHEISDLINSYSFGIDNYDTPLLMELFTESGTFAVYANGQLAVTRVGSEERYTEFSERAERRIANGQGQGRHYITNIVLEKNSATSVSGKVMALVLNKTPSDSFPEVLNTGYYEFEFSLVDANWKISSLTLHYD